MWDVSEDEYVRRDVSVSESALCVFRVAFNFSRMKLLSGHTHPADTNARTPASAVASNMSSVWFPVRFVLGSRKGVTNRSGLEGHRPQ